MRQVIEKYYRDVCGYTSAEAAECATFVLSGLRTGETESGFIMREALHHHFQDYASA